MSISMITASLRKPRAMFAPLLVLALLAGCAAGAGADGAPSPLVNIGDAKIAALQYKRSGAYDRDLAAVDAEAQAYIERRAGAVSKPALVLDIDETSLSNWPELEANDFGYIPNGPCNLPKGPCGVRTWELMAKAEPIKPTLALFNAAKGKGVAVFFITGRDESERDATEKNLRDAGYSGWAALILRPVGLRTASAVDYKTREREKIAAQGFTIIASVGDQPSDLAGGFAERTFLLPDPFYRIP